MNREKNLMWLFTTDGFLSVVHKGCRPDQVMVRARVRADLKRAFPKAKITRTPPPADYRFRAVVTRKALAAYLGRMVERLAYANFKDTVRDEHRHRAYLRVWTAMLDLQEFGRPEPPRTLAPAPKRRIHPGNYDEQPKAKGRLEDLFSDLGI